MLYWTYGISQDLESLMLVYCTGPMQYYSIWSHWCWHIVLDLCNITVSVVIDAGISYWTSAISHYLESLCQHVVLDHSNVTISRVVDASILYWTSAISHYLESLCQHIVLDLCNITILESLMPAYRTGLLQDILLPCSWLVQCMSLTSNSKGLVILQETAF